MKCTKFSIPYTSKSIPIRIKPISDVHLGAKHCDIRAFKKYLDDDNAWFLGLGDLMDCILPGDPRYRKSGDDTDGDDAIDIAVDKAYSYLEPIKDRLIGLADGNHETQIQKRHGTNPIKRLCKRLGCTYLGYSGLMKLYIYKPGKNGATTCGTSIVIRYHHGWGGGSRTQGADLTKYSKDIQHWDADLYLYGHVHRLQWDSLTRVGIAGENKLISKSRMVAICGTFLKTYSTSEISTYAEEKGYPPVSIGGLTINIKKTEHWVKMWAEE